MLALAAAVGVGLAPAKSRAQIPPPPSPIYPPASAKYDLGTTHGHGHSPGAISGHGYPSGALTGHVHELGPLAGAAHHVGFVIKDNLIGYPEEFLVPPLGASLASNFGAMAAKADLHDFILYRSDFVAETGALTPAGAAKLNRMIGRLPFWTGPLVVERVPDRPGLAELRREGLLASLDRAGHYIDPGRVMVGGSPYDGMYGELAELNYDSVLFRHQSAQAAFPLPPLPTANFSP